MPSAPLLENTHSFPQPSPASFPCPFREGKETIDLLLAEMREGDLLDATLDLRCLLQARLDAEECLAQLFRIRRLLDERHYLAFYRVRCWIRRLIAAEVRPDRVSDWTRCELPLGGARLGEVINSCLARLAVSDAVPTTAQVRFVFVTEAQESGCGPTLAASV